MSTSHDAPSPMRARFRDQVRQEVKEAALRQIASGGTGAVSVNAIARELGVSGPALYRYFASRDELLAELVADAYHDLAQALGVATAPALGLPPQDRVRALAGAWRSFALSQPHRYVLLFVPPVPGYDAHAEPLADAADRVMAVTLEVFAAAGRAGPPAPATGPGLAAVEHSPWQEGLAAVGAGPQDLLRVVSAWARIHGLVSLEIGGGLAAMGIDADVLFRGEVESLLAAPGEAGPRP